MHRPGARLNIKSIFPGMENSIIKIPLSDDCLIFVMWIPKLARRLLIVRRLWGWLNTQMPSYQYMYSQCGDKTTLPPSYLHNSYTGQTTSFHWIRTLVLIHYGMFTRMCFVMTNGCIIPEPFRNTLTTWPYVHITVTSYILRADSRLSPSQWETSL